MKKKIIAVVLGLTLIQTMADMLSLTLMVRDISIITVLWKALQILIK